MSADRPVLEVRDYMDAPQPLPGRTSALFVTGLDRRLRPAAPFSPRSVVDADLIASEQVGEGEPGGGGPAADRAVWERASLTPSSSSTFPALPVPAAQFYAGAIAITLAKPWRRSPWDPGVFAGQAPERGPVVVRGPVQVAASRRSWSSRVAGLGETPSWSRRQSLSWP